MIPVFLNLMRLDWWLNVWLILQNAPGAEEKNIFSVAVWWDAVMSVRCVCSAVCSALTLADSGWCAGWWAWGAEVSHSCSSGVYPSLSVSQYLLLKSVRPCVMCVFMSSCWMIILSTHAVLLCLFVSVFDLKMILSDISYSCLFGVSLCLEYLFLALHFQFICIVREVNFL